MASWPATLPQNIRIPLNYSFGNGRLRTRMDAGPVKMRRRYTAVEDSFTTTMVMNGQQFQDFKDFYENDLNGGVERFDWENPVDDSTVEMRFVEPPESEIRVGGTPVERTWIVNMQLEIMP